ncbi:MAG: hypothetical protein QOI11_1147 [Candidatus Eremiobacteraeota bacterium]|jgi:hypothetical protein|nr:hypothetical protein [Candidatus Eremiobacteraeota bacterium]
MRFTRSAWLCALIASSACAGAGGIAALPPPAAAGDESQATARTDESLAAGVIYVAFPDRIDVYPKTATGSPLPVRSLTGLPSFGPLALDRFQNLYIGDGTSWTVREYGPDASGRARPIRVFTAPDRAHPSQSHRIAGIALRYDGGVAVLAERGDSPPLATAIGVFSARDGGFDIAQERPGPIPGATLTVDGAGNVLFAYKTGPDRIDPAPMNIERFSPHPRGFNDDGVVATIPGYYAYRQNAMAASAHDALQFNQLRCNGSDGRTVTCAEDIGVAPYAQALKFDAEERLYSVSVGPHPSTQSIVEVYPAAPHEAQGRLRFFYPHRTMSAGDFSGPFDLAVSN